jgi:hypothetical protein
MPNPQSYSLAFFTSKKKLLGRRLIFKAIIFLNFHSFHVIVTQPRTFFYFQGCKFCLKRRNFFAKIFVETIKKSVFFFSPTFWVRSYFLLFDKLIDLFQIKMTNKQLILCEKWKKQKKVFLCQFSASRSWIFK